MSGAPAGGSTPPGAAGEQEAARWVRGMFGRVARRYDFLNHLLSFHLDRYWRARTVRLLRPILSRPGATVLDLCCGTGDLLAALETAQGRPAFGADFCRPMLEAAQRKLAARRLASRLVEADALALPFADGSLDAIAIAFGFRNLANYRKGLAEMHRALKPGGAAAVLEFSQPRHPVFAALYRLYAHRLLPALGGWVSGDPDAYRYLPESVRRFPPPEELAAAMHAAGFTTVEYHSMTGGIVVLHIGRKG